MSYILERKLFTMKKQKTLLSILLALLLAFQVVPVPNSYENITNQVTAEAASKKVKITNVPTGTLTVKKGESFQLKANIASLKWKSSNKKTVTVNKTGKLKGITNGVATVTASAKNTKASVKVTVGTKVSRVNVVKPAIALVTGGQSTIKAEVSPADASNQTLIFQSADKEIASVSKEGVVTANKTGTTKITVNASDGTEKKETVIVTVRAPGSPVRLQDDFYQAINATILNEHALQGNQYEWDGFNELQNRITNDLNSLLDELVAQKNSIKKVQYSRKSLIFICWTVIWIQGIN